MKRQHTPADFCKAPERTHVTDDSASAPEPHAPLHAVDESVTRVLVRRTIVLGTEHGRLPSVPPPTAAGSHVPPVTVQLATRAQRVAVNPGALTLRIGSPEPSFPLTREQLVIPVTAPAHMLDSEDLIRTTLRLPFAPHSEPDPDDLRATTVQQPTRVREDEHEHEEDPEDLLQTRLRPSGHCRSAAEVEDLSATRIEPSEFLDTMALRELTLPPEVEARLPPPPPPARTPRTFTDKLPRLPPPLRATGRHAARSAQRHVLSRTIKHAQSQPQDQDAPRRNRLYARWLARRPTTVLSRVAPRRKSSAWLWAAALGACSMVVAYAITDHFVSRQAPEHGAVLRELTPEDAAQAQAAGTPALTLSAGTSAR